MARSFPEKTFEHWCSIHLGYRYKAQVHMWWPASGADLEIARLPGAFGKRIWLELKTTEWVAKSARHELGIDLDQLDRYALDPIPDYYVFPQPPWTGNLDATTTWLGGIAPSQIAYQSQSGDKWFAEWTKVVSGEVLRRRLAPEIAKMRASGSKKKRIVIARVANGLLSWTRPALSGVTPLEWRAFWAAMQGCGSSSLGAQFVVPSSTVSSPNPPRSDLVAALAAAKDKQFPPHGQQGFVAFSPLGDDHYQPTTAAGGFGAFDWVDPHRALVHLALGALDL